MTTISSYTTQSGVRYRVRYRKPDGSQTDKRGFKRKRDAEQWAAEHVTTAKAQGSFIDPQDAKITVGESAPLHPRTLRGERGAFSRFRTVCASACRRGPVPTSCPHLAHIFRKTRVNPSKPKGIEEVA